MPEDVRMTPGSTLMSLTKIAHCFHKVTADAMCDPYQRVTCAATATRLGEKAEKVVCRPEHGLGAWLNPDVRVVPEQQDACIGVSSQEIPRPEHITAFPRTGLVSTQAVDENDAVNGG